MSEQIDAKAFADEWIAAWNRHDLGGILSHYAPDVVLVSPVVSKVTGNLSGTITGKAALGNYFQKGLEMFPNLHFTLLDVMRGISSIVLYYENQRSTRTGEFMEFNEEGKVIRVIANYSS